MQEGQEFFHPAKEQSSSPTLTPKELIKRWAKEKPWQKPKQGKIDKVLRRRPLERPPLIFPEPEYLLTDNEVLGKAMEKAHTLANTPHNEAFVINPEIDHVRMSGEGIETRAWVLKQLGYTDEEILDPRNDATTVQKMIAERLGISLLHASIFDHATRTYLPQFDPVRYPQNQPQHYIENAFRDGLEHPEKFAKPETVALADSLSKLSLGNWENIIATYDTWKNWMWQLPQELEPDSETDMILRDATLNYVREAYDNMPPGVEDIKRFGIFVTMLDTFAQKKILNAEEINSVLKEPNKIEEIVDASLLNKTKEKEE